MRFHRLQNVQIALDFLKQRQVSTPRAVLLLPGAPSRSVLGAPGQP